MSENRCGICGEVGHKRTAHATHAPYNPSLAVRRKSPPTWYVELVDAGVHEWSGPYHYNVALAAARAFEAASETTRTKLCAGRSAWMHGESRGLPFAWRDYEPTEVDRVPRINAGKSRAA